MKKYGWLLIPLVASGWSCSTEPAWRTHTLDGRVRVQVPGDLVELPAAMLSLLGLPATPGQAVWGAEDAHGLYLVVRQTPGHITDRDRYYAGVVKGLVGRAHGEVLARSAFATAAGNGLELVFAARDPGSGQRVVQVSRHLLVDSRSYSFSVVSSDEPDGTGASSRQSRRFFDSVAATPRAQPMPD